MNNPLITREQITQVLATKFGIHKPREYQVALINSLVSGKNVIAAMPTGWGKSSLYQVAGLFRGGLTIVITPTISLMEDQVRELREIGINAGCLHSETSMDARDAVNESLDNRSLQFLFISPQAFEMSWSDHLPSTHSVGLIAVDEAHLIVDWGMGGLDAKYRTAYKRLHQRFAGVPVIATTGTATSETIGYIRSVLKLDDDTVVGKVPADRTDINFKVVRTDEWSDTNAVLVGCISDLVDKHHDVDGHTGIVFTVTNRDGYRLKKLLSQTLGIDVPFYSSKERSWQPNLLEEITTQLQNGEVPFVIATSSLGQGLNISNLRWVVHDGMRPTIEDYWQQVGRIGRDGVRSANRCDAVLVGNPERDAERWAWRYESIDSEYLQQAERREFISLNYYDWPGCRRGYLVGYLQDSQGPDCSGCDNCDKQHPSAVTNEEFLNAQDAVRAQLSMLEPNSALEAGEWIKHIKYGIGVVVDKGPTIWTGMFAVGKKNFLPDNGFEPVIAGTWRHAHGESTSPTELRAGQHVCANREVDGTIIAVDGIAAQIRTDSGETYWLPRTLYRRVSQEFELNAFDPPVENHSRSEKKEQQSTLRVDLDWRNNY